MIGATWRLTLALAMTAMAVTQPGGPVAPADALATLQTEPGLRVELAAHEPAIMSPIAMDVDEDGRLFVVEMPGYPLDSSPTGRIRVLEDADGDGRFERSTLFADDLEFPTGIMRWRRGVLVTAAPDILYLEDSDGDGRADVRRVVLTGFARTNPQHRVNTPVYGLDNWITVAHEGPAEAIIFRTQFGDQGGALRFPGDAAAPALPPRPRSIRFRLDPNRLEARSGSSQFGHAFDAYGRYFTLDNSNHARHEVIAARYLERNPDLVVERAMIGISDHADAATVFPITKRPQFEMLSEVGQITSACSLTFELGGAWPSRFDRSVFVAEPVHNLVHRDRYDAAGPTFVARRTSDASEMLASTDPWFRPVNLYLGPDGALYVVDYYRRLIEHPEWTASDRHVDAPSLYEGRDRGRIYRVSPEGASRDAWPRRGALSAASDEALVARLGHRNAWHRRTAQRLLVDRRSAASIPLLERAVRERPSAFARLHALWTLEGLDRLDPDLVRLALSDGDPGVRENAAQLAERWMAASPAPSAAAAPAREALVAGVLALASDPDARVRFQALATLGGVDTPAAHAARERLLFASLDDEWMTIAGLSAASERAAPLLRQAIAELREPGGAGTSAGRTRFLEQLASMAASHGGVSEIDLAIRPPGLVRPDVAWARAALLRGLARGLASNGPGREAVRARQADVLALIDGGDAAVRRAALDLVRAAGFVRESWTAGIVSRAARTARTGTADTAARVDAITLLRLSGAEPHETLLRGLVTPTEPEPVQTAAIEALGRLPGRSIGDLLIERWASFTPDARHAAAQALLADPARARLLLGAMAKGTVPAWTLGFWEKRDLVMHEDAAIRAEARRLLEERPDERAAIVTRYAAALDQQGDAARGREVFTRVCASCHRRDAVGDQTLGPDLATVRHRPLSQLLEDILVPGRSIAQRYETWVVTRADGSTEAGVLAAQTPTSVTLRVPGREIVIPRRAIRSLRVVPQSAMPADLDKVIAPAQMADLLRFLTESPQN